MAEQQLIDYIKKARAASQADEQSRNLLYKNGWTVAEVDEAIASLGQSSPTVAQQPKPQQPQAQPAQIQAKPLQQVQAQPQPQPKPQPQPNILGGMGAGSAMPRMRSHRLSKLLISLVILIVIGAAGYSVAGQFISLLFADPKIVISNMLTNMKNVKSSQTTMQLSVGELTADIVSNGEMLWFKINNITLPESATIFAVPKLQGVWLAIDQDSVKAITAVSGSNIPQVNASDLFTFKKNLGSQNVNGQSAYHYLLTISNDKIKSIAPSAIDPFVTTIGDVDVEIWIGKKDYMLYKVSIDKIISGVAIKFVGTNSNFNQPVTIQAPENTIKLETVLLPALKAQKAAAYISQIGGIAQSLSAVGQTVNSLCNRGLLNGYLATFGGDLINLHKDILSLGAIKPSCFSSGQDFCVSTQLADGTYICIDKNMVLGTTKCVSATTECK